MQTDGIQTPLSSRVRAWLVLASVVLVVVSVGTGLFVLGPHEPRYGGVGLSAWLEGPMSPAPLILAKQRVEVLRSVGPEALPWLTRAFEGYSGRTSWSRLELRYLHFYVRQSATVRGFLPRPLYLRAEMVRHNAISILSRIAPGTSYEDRVLRALGSAPDLGNSQLAKTRLYALACFTNRPTLVVPLLLAGLTNLTTIDSSIEGLRHFPSSASDPLYKMALKERGPIRPAELALQKVDPDAYDRLRKEKQAF